MVVAVSVRADTRAMTRGLSRTQRKAVPNASAKALNRARNTTQTHTLRRTAHRLGAAQKRLRRRILKSLRRNARATRQRASFTVGTLPVPVEWLGRFRQTGEGVDVGKLGTFEGAFVALMPSSGHVGVYRRYGSKTIVNTTRYGEQLKQRIAKVTYDIGPIVRYAGEQALKTEGREMFRKRFEHELKRELQKIGAR